MTNKEAEKGNKKIKETRGIEIWREINNLIDPDCQDPLKELLKSRYQLTLLNMGSF